MAKVNFPLFSNEARGSIGKIINFQMSRGKAVVRKYFSPGYTLTIAQNIVRQWFKDGLDWWKKMSAEEHFLWELALKNYREYSKSQIAYTKRWGRCLFLHQTLLTRSFEWEGSPFPPSLIQMLAPDEIADYDQLMADLELLTGLSFCQGVNPFFFPYLGNVQSKNHPGYGQEVKGLASAVGVAIALDEDYYWTLNAYQKRLLVAHELTHALMAQHLWNYPNHVAMSETIANECGTRTAQGELVPVYTYQGKTLSEWVPNPGCE